MYGWSLVTGVLESCNRPLPPENPGQLKENLDFGTIPGILGRLATMCTFANLLSFLGIEEAVALDIEGEIRLSLDL